MRKLTLLAFACLATVSALVIWPQPHTASALEVEKYHVFCADDRIEVSFWDREQMIVRRGNPVCLFATYTSRSSAMTFAEKNFGGEGKPCFCE